MNFRNIFKILKLEKYTSSLIFKNIGWLFFDKFCRLGIGLFVGVWVAKYLGPDNFGKWNYSIAIVAILSALSTLGLDQVLVKSLIEHENDEDYLMGTAFFLRFFGAILAVIFACIYIYFQSGTALLLITFITALNLVFQCFDVIDLKLQSVLKSKVSVIIKNSAFIAASVLKLLVIHNKGGLLLFVIISLIEIMLGALGLAFNYGLPRVMKWRFNMIYAKKLLLECWPLLLSGIIILLYMRIDQVMIGSMLSTTDVGLYSVSVKFSELWYFIPTVFANSFFPKLIKLKIDVVQYKRLCSKLLKLLFLISFFISAALSLCAGKLISTLYGASYIASAFALQISIWTSIFVFWGVGAANMLLIEDLNKHNLYKSIQGLVLNVILNLLLIPRLGINGAAIATLISQFYASYLYYLFPKSTRHIFVLQSKSILFFLNS
ncbi:flippase [Mucilaginibacter rubeus]|uniref:Flippase n=1 Tax=Mucilaginibacter rubeus TaxID=2027860 RepID=A0AAE6JDM1_9SPHI|nr:MULTISPECIES: flippase [Mucilaginibacter]QEM03451.1 flippase [Mucilaginibacter rubeus]QEM16066.1 flippase [Mucilaginibacter gossypii]QTE41180.1 flippase [Mucilaginibacter rubeus]QTE47784.1 flippase [Mucilaginibacter rubeus]QTE59175.1 flippase [Mucilaginibacter rubeus]